MSIGPAQSLKKIEHLEKGRWQISLFSVSATLPAMRKFPTLDIERLERKEKKRKKILKG